MTCAQTNSARAISRPDRRVESPLDQFLDAPAELQRLAVGEELAAAWRHSEATERDPGDSFGAGSMAHYDVQYGIPVSPSAGRPVHVAGTRTLITFPALWFALLPAWPED